MQRISEMQVRENEKYGCCIAFGLNEDIEHLTNCSEFKETFNASTCGLDGIFYACRKPDWRKYIFVVNANIPPTLHGTIMADLPLDPWDRIKKLSDLTLLYNIIIFFTEPFVASSSGILRDNIRSINMFSKGKWRAEYMFQKIRGKWQLRLFGKSLQLIKNVASDFDQKLVERLWETSWYASYANPKGKLIVVGKEDLNGKLFFEEKKKVPQPINVYDKKFLDYVLTPEGGIYVPPDGQVTKADVTIRARGNFEIPYDLEEKIEQDGFKTKHRSGATISVSCPNALVFIISESRGISVLRNGKPVLWVY